MGKMSELSLLIDTLISCGETLADTGRALKECFTSPDEPAPAEREKERTEKETSPPEAGKRMTPLPGEGEAAEPAAAEGTPRYSKEEVRGILAAKAGESGGKYRIQVKALIRRYAGGGSLTDVPEECYPALVKETEGLKE